MKVFFAGTPQNAAETLRALKKSGVDVVGVLTRTDAPVGRKRELTASAVATGAGTRPAGYQVQYFRRRHALQNPGTKT